MSQMPASHHVQIRPAKGWLHLDVPGLWQYRDLISILVWRDVKVRYKQTLLGAAWAMFQPLATMVIFTAVFTYAGRIESEGLPYPELLYAGLLPWLYISQAVGRSANSLVGEAPLISKIYFPRLILPLSAVISPLIDLLLALVLFFGLVIWYGDMPTWRILSLPLFICFAVLIALAVGVWVSALYVKYRDIGHIVPMFIQLWMFVSPVIYPASAIPDSWRAVYGLNPMVGVIQGFRWALLPNFELDLAVLGPSFAIVIIVLFSGVIYFRTMERAFADII